ncbi:MAG: phage major capsid protein, partial [Eggerthellaceae bacterium]|nr:phage major capsid protein [Eggerthellaceae bacterium]
MSKILDMRKKRGEIWDQAKAFLDAHQDENGVMSAEDTQTYERMEQEVVDLGHAIDRLERAEQMDRELNSDPANPMLTSRPDRSDRTDTRRGIASDAYKKAFWDQLRGKTSYEIRDALQVGELTEGGYTVPTEFENQLVEGLEEENIMRGLVHVITTSSGDRKIPLVTNYGNASWIEEEQQIPESDVGFGQVSLGAHKLATAIRISQELLNDSAFDMAAFITHEFQRRAGAAEEEAIIAGDGSHKPVGLLHDTLGAQVGVTAASATAITADELIDLQHS